MPAIDYARFYRYDELMALLRAFAAENPGYVEVESLGRSHEGRDIPLVTLTNGATGPRRTSRRTGSTATSTRSN